MSTFEASITNSKKQLEFYKQLSEQLQQENKKQKEVIDMFLEKVDKNKKLLNNPELLDLYLKIKEV